MRADNNTMFVRSCVAAPVFFHPRLVNPYLQTSRATFSNSIWLDVLKRRWIGCSGDWNASVAQVRNELRNLTRFAVDCVTSRRRRCSDTVHPQRTRLDRPVARFLIAAMAAVGAFDMSQLLRATGRCGAQCAACFSSGQMRGIRNPRAPTIVTRES